MHMEFFSAFRKPPVYFHSVDGSGSIGPHSNEIVCVSVGERHRFTTNKRFFLNLNLVTKTEAQMNLIRGWNAIKWIISHRKRFVITTVFFVTLTEMTVIRPGMLINYTQICLRINMNVNAMCLLHFRWKKMDSICSCNPLQTLFYLSVPIFVSPPTQFWSFE